ncbi:MULTISPECIES: hypothetical protein [Enterobacter cloacae complex]|uniref:Uncharacterized protein n=1 Tax=Enterobacter genomosp. O TaxID=2364150 RepID=A0A0X4EJM0_9ENTR|nr:MULTISPECIES: hypothetical protein [Enterobacter cloacae complex]KUQ81892.1 hypothetical protein AWI28_20775 [Enterobacter genomosp. O]KZQ35791.1 hypothetical protein A3464_14850 [Enterobacter genomosp. O]MCM7108820.1 hypothetical protein [Enterobacter cloacae]
MNWPVQIIPPADKVPGIKWSKWFFSFVTILLVVVISWVGAKIISPTEESVLLKLLTLLFFLVPLAFSLIISFRSYYYGLCLSAFEAAEREAALVKKTWTEWASQKFYVSAYKLFLPSVISQTDIAMSNAVEIYNNQQLKLRGHNDDLYTEEQLVYELLASVRARLLRLRESCVFDVIFTYDSSYITFSTFKECWAAIGFDVSCLGNYYCWGKTLEQEFDTLSNISSNRVAIIISANNECFEKYPPNSTEFASILLVNHQEQLPEKDNNGVALRAMACDKNLTKQEVIHMMTYQPDVLKTTKVLFSNMSIEDVSVVSEILRLSSLSMNVEWEYEIKHLNLILGNLDEAHFWLVFALALFISEKNNEPVLMVASVGDEYVFNVIKPFDNSKER